MQNIQRLTKRQVHNTICVLSITLTCTVIKSNQYSEVLLLGEGVGVVGSASTHPANNHTTEIFPISTSTRKDNTLVVLADILVN